MSTRLKRTTPQRAVAVCLAAAIVCVTAAPQRALAIDPGITKQYGRYVMRIGESTDASWTDAFESVGISQGYYPTGLNYGQLDVDVNGSFPVEWVLKQGDTQAPAPDGFDYNAFVGHTWYCAGGHVPDPAKEVYNQAFSKGTLRLNENGDLVNSLTGDRDPTSPGGTNQKFSQLMMIAAMGYHSDWSSIIGSDGFLNNPADIDHWYQVGVTLRRMHLRISDGEGYTGDWATDFERFNTFAANTDLNEPCTNPIAAAMGCTRKDQEIFWSVWTAATLNMNMSFFEGGEAVKNPSSSVTNADGSTTNVYDFSKELVNAGIQNLLNVQVDGGTYSWDTTTGSLTVTAPAGTEVSGEVVAQGESWDGQVNGSIPNFGSAIIGRFYWAAQESNHLGSVRSLDFSRSQNYLSVIFTEAYRFSFGGEVSQDSELTVHRYDHMENWRADYNIRLYKFDSETGQPLQDVRFDILEKFDDSQIDKTDLDADSADESVSADALKEGVTWKEDKELAENAEDPNARLQAHYEGDIGLVDTSNNLCNWANESGSQFQRWDDPYDDPCQIDDEITNADGRLSTNGTSVTGTPAHNDTKTYYYHKGYCGGHPAPEIEYVECTHGDGEACDCDTVNQQLHDEAWKEWYEEVETCIDLVNEGGFFHAIEEGKAQEAMEEDRDQFYKDFTSLTYEYSADELQARTGYIQHGLHTDDIPIEWRTVTSSQYKDWNSRGSLNHIGGSSEGGDEGEEEFSSFSLSPANHIARTYVSDVFYDDIIIGSPSDTVRYAYDNAMEEYLAEHGTDAADPELYSEAMEEELPDIELADEESDDERIEIAETTEDATEDIVEDTAEESVGDIVEDVGADIETATGSDARPSETDAVKKDEALDHLIEGTDSQFSFRTLVNDAGNLIKRVSGAFISLFDMDDEEDEDEGEGGDDHSSGALHEELVTEPSIASLIDPDEPDTIDWTFVLYDHRTEGEIHINKRDFNLSDNVDETFDDYAAENGDGSLEGAVYGLFADTNIVHPDGHTGVVYQAGDLVAIATTDRNGDASFMTFTEAPGTRYNYETGKTEKTDWNQKAPTNLHRNQDAAAQDVVDIEVFEGHNPDNTAITAGKDKDLKDTADSGDGTTTWYKKYSSNQNYDSGQLNSNEVTNEKRDTYCTEETIGYYPISDNESNNGNCWIGRPLIVSGQDSISYYVKELSRSEGYELSVNGKDGELTNRYADLETRDKTVTLNVSKITKGGNAGDGVYNYNEFTVHSEGTNTYRVEMKNVPSEHPHVYVVTEEVVWDENAPAGADVATRSVPQKAIPGNYVYIDGKKVEAQVGGEIHLPNGETAIVKAVSTTDPLTLTVMPGNHVTTTMPTVAFSNQSAPAVTDADFKKLVTEYNNELTKQGVNLPVSYSKAAPYFLVPLTNVTTAQGLAQALNAALQSQTLFNRFYVQGVETVGGVKCAVVRYSYMEGASKIPVAIYDTDTKKIYLHAPVTYIETDPVTGKTTETVGYVFVPYEQSEYTVVSEQDGFVTKATLSQKTPDFTEVQYPSDMSGLSFGPARQASYWIYDEDEQMRDNQGNLLFRVEETRTPLYGAYVTKTSHKEITPVQKSADGTYFFEVTLDDESVHDVRFHVAYEESYDENWVLPNAYFAQTGIINLYTESEDSDTYQVTLHLGYPGETTILQDDGTINSPAQVYERPIRQKVSIEKDIQTLPETKEVWYCLNCGHEIENGIGACEVCGKTRTTEETRYLNYANDTYAAFHSENISAKRDAGSYETTEDWLSALNGNRAAEESPAGIGNFRFKAYLKSNLERLYRDEEGNVTWMDRNGNTMTPKYKDTNGDGNYDTFTWQYDTAYDGKTVDFPEKDKVTQTDNQEDVLTMTNVQKIYTEVEHPTGDAASKVTSDRANNVWDTYADPQNGARANAGEIEGYTTSEKGDPGDSVTTNAALYSYDGQARDRNKTDYLQDQQNTGYTRLLETRRQEIEDGTGKTSVEMYNYEKFFDAIQAANTDIWDNDMYSTYDGTGLSMKNYPGQNWFETFYEKYQKDDADPDHTIDNTDKQDADNTAGGDRDTSFKPFRWIRELVFGDRTDYETYPAERNGENTENTANTSKYARANAEASDAVRQFAVKWYLDDEAAKLMVDNGLGENVANQEKLGTNTEGKIGYDEAVYDLALFNAIAKAYNYLKPFYLNDLDTIYSVEWDSAPNGGSDNDYTTLSADINTEGTYSNVSSYLPYGVYVIVEQQPQRRDAKVNDWENRSYDIEKPKEVIVPSLYEENASDDTTDNYDKHYTFSAEQLLTDQAKKANYLIRFGEENSANTQGQDQREFVIRAHNYNGDFEVYKYGLDVDQLQGTITSPPNGDYTYGGWTITQEAYDPLKDYYGLDHRGEEGVVEIQIENGGNQGSLYYGNEQNYTANGNGVATANGDYYDGDSLRKRFFYASISEDDGEADKILFKDGDTDQNNMSGMSWHDDVKSTTGELTAYDGLYAAALVPWTITEPTDGTYDAATFTGYADVNERNRFYTAYLRINKTDSETGEYILHDDAIFGLYAASRYNSFEEIEADAELITDADEKARFLMQFKPGDAKFYLQDTMITGTREFLEAMKARDITPYAKGKQRSTLNESMAEAGELCTGIVSKGTPVCIESERVDLYDGDGSRTGQMTVWTTRGDLPMDDPETQTKLEDGGQNVGYFKTSQPIGAGVYVLAEIKPPSGYARSNPVAIEVYSDGTTYYVDGDMYAKVDAVRYESKTTDGYPYKNADEANARQ